MSTLKYMEDRANKLQVKTTDDFGEHVIRSQETMGLPEGIEFTIPKVEDWKGKVRWESFPNARINPKTGKPEETPYMLLKVNGSEEGIRFYPSTLVKQVWECDENGVNTGKIIYAKGTATDLFKQYNMSQEGMLALAGKTLRVSHIEQVRTRSFNQAGTPRYSNVPTIDIVENKTSRKK